MDGVVEMIVAFAGAFGGLSALKFLFFMKPESRKAKAEADIKEIEADEKEMGVMKSLVESLKARIEQQDEKIRELNERVDKLYIEKHELEKINNELTRENNELRLQLMEARHNLCVRPDEECLKRIPPRDYFRHVKHADQEYNSYHTKGVQNESDGVPEEADREQHRCKQ